MDSLRVEEEEDHHRHSLPSLPIDNQEEDNKLLQEIGEKERRERERGMGYCRYGIDYFVQIYVHFNKRSSRKGNECV